MQCPVFFIDSSQLLSYHMLMYKIAVIPPIPLTKAELQRRERQYRQYSGSCFEIEIRMLKGGPPLTDNEEDLLLASKFIIEEAIISEKEGSDAIVIDFTTVIRGWKELEAQLKIPVIAPGIAALKDAEMMISSEIEPSWKE